MKLLKRKSWICWLICVLFLWTNLFCGQNETPQKVYASSEVDLYEQIDQYLFDVTKKANFPSLSITIVDKSQTLLSKTYGVCDNVDTPYFLGSVSKSFTALAIMQLVEERKIDLNAKISTYLTDAHDGDHITVLQLLNHTSGLGEHQNLKNYQIVGKQNQHCYANVNYSLLGKIIESASGLTYESYMTQHIFTPLSMDKTAATIEKAKENGVLEGYENWFGNYVKTEPKFPQNEKTWISVPAGYLSSSTSDLGKYLQMYLNRGKGIISKESIQQMFYQNVPVKAKIPYQYGMGWTLIEEPLKEPALRHAGLVETGMSVICILPERDIGFAMTMNGNDYFVGKDMMDRIDWGVVLMLLGEKPNQIGEQEYFSRHLLYNSLYLIVFCLSILPFCFLIFSRREESKKRGRKILFLIFYHFLFPTILLLLPQLCFATPLWVVKAFVPDLFFTILVSSCLLFLGGIIKGGKIIREHRKNA